MKINKTNLAFFISSACMFTLNMAMEGPKTEAKITSAENELYNQPNLANMPNEIKVKIINDIVNNIIDSNNNLPVIGIIKSIAKELLPLRQIDREFNELINDYISRDLSRILKSNGIDINQKDTVGYPALLSAIKMKHPELAKLIIELGVDVNEKHNNGNTALILAARYGYEESIVRLLINNDANNVNVRNAAGYTALMEASWHGHKDIVRLLIDNEANVYKRNNYGYTALDIAKIRGYEDIIGLLQSNATLDKI